MNVQTTIEQLGGNKFLAMTGAIIHSTLEDTLTLKLPAMSKARVITIKLAADDTYTVQAFTVHKTNIKFSSSVAGVHCDMLQDVFTQLTGLYTSL